MEKYKLAEGEPMALIDNRTLERIRSASEMPEIPHNMDQEMARAYMVSHLQLLSALHVFRTVQFCLASLNGGQVVLWGV